MSSRENNRKNMNKILLIILIFFLVICLLGGLGYVVFNWYSGREAERSYGELQQYNNADSSMTENLRDNPIDFVSLKEQNEDIYAWIEVPNTNINYPVVQSRVDDNFYLNKGIDKKYLFAGMIYSQSMNSLDFYDPVTVLYGHNMNNGTMFQNLHKFQNKEFFNENDHFFVYTKNHILTYKIVSAFKYDNRHIMNSFDFNIISDLADFQNTVTNPDSLLKNVREDTEIDYNSKILVLSTCIGDKRSRYLVCGVMIDDEKTK